MNPLKLVNLPPLMEFTSGRPEILVGLIDGPVASDHPDLAGGNLRVIPGKLAGSCIQDGTFACQHATFVAGILFARKDAPAPSICPNCTLLVRPIFAESNAYNGQLPGATPEELAEAIIETIDAGAVVINLSAALVQPSVRGERELRKALDYAAGRRVIIVAAAGNQASVGSSCITRHPWVIPVAACDLQGRPLNYTNLGDSIGRRGLCAPGQDITSLGANGASSTFSGTSAAAPFVTGTVALLFSAFPYAAAAEVKLAVNQAHGRRRSVIPPVLDAWGAYQVMAINHRRR